MKPNKNPKWWTAEHDSAWERTKAAFQRDWDQTKHDMGRNEPDTNQGVKHTINQATGKEAIPPRGKPVYDYVEPAYRFGYGARAHYGEQYPDWNNELESRLQADWRDIYPSSTRNWDDDLEHIRDGWNYDEISDDTPLKR